MNTIFRAVCMDDSDSFVVQSPGDRHKSHSIRSFFSAVQASPHSCPSSLDVRESKSNPSQKNTPISPDKPMRISARVGVPPRSISETAVSMLWGFGKSVRRTSPVQRRGFQENRYRIRSLTLLAEVCRGSGTGWEDPLEHAFPFVFRKSREIGVPVRLGGRWWSRDGAGDLMPLECQWGWISGQ